MVDHHVPGAEFFPSAYVSRVSDFLMGDVDSGPGLGIPQTRRSRVRPRHTHFPFASCLSSPGPFFSWLSSKHRSQTRVQTALLKGSPKTSGFFFVFFYKALYFTGKQPQSHFSLCRQD